jgi:5-formyltetrahydrofolate cyclo-ligase
MAKDSQIPPDPKILLREKLKTIRDFVDHGLAETASQGVWNILKTRPEFIKAKAIGAFASIPHEINTYPILEGTLSSDKKLYLPKVSKDKESFEFHPVTDLKNLQPGPFGILEPTSPKPVEWDELDLILVPGLAFDRQGNRLGFGKGFYDRVIPQLKKSCLVVGLGYAFQLVEKVPTDTHDAPVRAVLCETGFYLCGKPST